jgi:predicted nucleic acid-binding protein
MMIALVNRADALHGVAVKLFEEVARGKLGGAVIPASAYMEYELVLRSRGYNSEAILGDIEAFRRIENLGEVPLTARVIVEAARLRDKYGLTYFDSLHAASALYHDKTIISTDNAYQKVPGLRTIDPRKLVVQP